MALTTSHAKRERLNFKGATYHITTRCNDKQNLIQADIDFKRYVFILKKCKKKYGFFLHDYVPMNNHVHLVIRLELVIDISKIMHSINRWYARWYNSHYQRKGHFWEDRFYGELIRDDRQLLAVMRYIELNPVRAGLCKEPTDWAYSGARFYLNGKTNKLIDTPDAYLTMGNTDKSRQQAYSCIFPIS